MFPRFFPLAIVLAACSLACAGASAPPRTEFLIATTDSTYWVHSGPDGVHVRGVPMTLVRYAGRFHEVYVADLDRSFDSAIFTGERVYARDLLTSDSVLIYEDSSVVRLAKRYASENPNARPLAANDETPEAPELTASGETDILDVRGSLVLLEHRSTVEQLGGSRSDTTRAVVDLRSAHGMTMSSIKSATVTPDSSMVTSLPHRWRRTGYELLARGDSATGTVSFVLHDTESRSWQVLTTPTHPRVYWLDSPAIPVATRRALLHAFDGAAAYDQAIKYVRNLVPPSLRTPVARAGFHT